MTEVEEKKVPQPWEVSPEFFARARAVAEETGDDDALNLIAYFVAERDVYLAEEKVAEVFKDMRTDLNRLERMRPERGVYYQNAGRLRDDIKELLAIQKRMPQTLDSLTVFLGELAEASERCAEFRRNYV